MPADLRFALRMLRKSPVFALVAIGTLALGIGANTAIFSVVNAVFLRPLPYAHPERLVWATEVFPSFKNAQMVFSPEYAAWRQQNKVFQSLEAYGISVGTNLAAGKQAAQRVQTGHVTPGFFTMLGVQPEIGRTFRPDEQHVALISDALWRSYFHADPGILEKSVSIDGKPTTVIGVMPPGFVDITAADTGIWLPDAMYGRPAVPGRLMSFLGGVIGRLKPGMTVEQAQADLNVIARRMDSLYPIPWSRYHAGAKARVVPLHAQLVSSSRTALYVLLGAVGFILLIACANVANMFLSRAAGRQREMATRAAVGASRSRLVGMLLMESVLLGAAGGLAGLLATYWGVSALRFLLPATIPPHIDVDLRVLGFAALCSIATGVIFGLAPAIAASKVDLSSSLKEGGAQAGGARGRLRAGLVVAQLALSLVLLVGAGLLIRSFFAVMNVNLGFNPRNVLTAEVSLSPIESYGPTRQAEFFQRALEAIERIPGVKSAAVTDNSPLATFQAIASGLSAEGQPPYKSAVALTSISADYFKTLQTHLIRGRFFTQADGQAAPRVAIINQSLARILFPHTDPIGHRIVFGEDKRDYPTVVGVVADIRHRGLDTGNYPELFQPYEQVPAPWMSLIIKTSGDPLSLTPALRKAVASVDRTEPVFGVQSLEQRLSNSTAQRRQRTLLLGIFALLALAMAVIGVYGVIAYSVARRTREMGIRIALGAQARDILLAVLADGLKMVFAGIAIGLAGALALTRVLSSFLFGIKATDAATFISVCFILVAAACLAAYLPARRATKVDPMVALREE